MATFPNIKGLLNGNSLPYALNVPVTSNEADLYNQATQDPFNTLYYQAIEAIVTLTTQGVSAQSAYVVMQTDMGDGTWVDIAWLVWNGTGQAVFSLSAGAMAAVGAVQQTRVAGVAPAGNGNNQMQLGARIRFVGKSTQSGSSSSSSSGGTVPQVLATIRYRPLALR